MFQTLKRPTKPKEPAANYDDLLRSARGEYAAVIESADKKLQSLEEQLRLAQAGIDHVRAQKQEAERGYHAAVVALAERRLAGEFEAEDHNGSSGTEGLPAGNSDARAEEACRAVDNQDDFIIADAEKHLREPMKRSTLTGAIGRLVDRGVLRVVEAGYKRRATRYAVVTPTPQGSPSSGVEGEGVAV